MSEEELDRAASNLENDITKDDIKEVADLLKMPSKVTKIGKWPVKIQLQNLNMMS